QDVGGAGDDLDARLDDPGEPRRPSVLDDPERRADRERRRDREPDDGQDARTQERVQEPAGAGLAAADLGAAYDQARAKVLDPADREIGDDRAGDQAQQQAGTPGHGKRETVRPAPRERRRAPPWTVDHRPPGRRFVVVKRAHARTWYF